MVRVLVRNGVTHYVLIKKEIQYSFIYQGVVSVHLKTSIISDINSMNNYEQLF